jgi:hypothetical protein
VVDEELELEFDDPESDDDDDELLLDPDVEESVPLPLPEVPSTPTQNPSTALHDSPSQHAASSMHHRTRSSCPTHSVTHAAGPRTDAPASYEATQKPDSQSSLSSHASGPGTAVLLPVVPPVDSSPPVVIRSGGISVAESPHAIASASRKLGPEVGDVMTGLPIGSSYGKLTDG